MGLKIFSVGFALLCCFCSLGFCDQDGFLSLACGGATNYTDSSNILWITDSDFISTGKTTNINDVEGTSSGVSLRFFPDSKGRNCYRLPMRNISSLILVRSQFVYKNYDGRGKPPAFSVSLGTAMASTINLTANDPWTEEFVWPINKDMLSFCLHQIPNGGTPVISSLEVRPLPPEAYKSGMGDFPNKSLRKSYRIDSGYTNGSLKYPADPYDRIWDADKSFTPFHVTRGFKIQVKFNLSGLSESPPPAVLQTARVLARKEVMTYNFPLDSLADYYVVLYFAGIFPISPSFDVIINGDIVQSNYTVKTSEISSLYVTRKGINSLNVTFKRKSFFPQVNAIEVYEIVDIPLEASSTTVSALQVIEQFTGLDLGWEDDPCSPKPWDHVVCEGSLVTSLELSDINLRSISPTFGDLLDLKTLDLHNTSLAGEIQNLDSLQNLEKLNLSFNKLTSFGSDWENLISLQVLDLRNNSLEGFVPDGLGELKDLRLLDLENNLLQGTLPDSLNRESLEVRTLGNLCLSFSTTACGDASSNPSIEAPQVTIVPKRNKQGHNHLAIILGAVGGASLVILLVPLFISMYRRRGRTEMSYTERAAADMRNWNAAKIFSYKEIKTATNNFKEVIGHGSFGSVYLGKLPDGKLVAVKVRFDKTQLGADSFINEGTSLRNVCPSAILTSAVRRSILKANIQRFFQVRLLSQVRHQNLVSLEGFCYESQRQILVYEYLPGGSLADHLYGPNSTKFSLSWVRRLKIAVDAAKGLDYLHNGSDPRIIHRDIKCSNILLDKEMNARLCDFGLSKQMIQPDATHVTTVVKGTAGYLDPEYYSTQQLTEKSDVYSFGVVLLELICGREPLSHSGTPDSFNLVLWAKPYLQAGAFEIVDESLGGSFDLESMRKVAKIAVRSVERDASQRPTIAQILSVLKESYSIQLSYLAASGHVN